MAWGCSLGYTKRLLTSIQWQLIVSIWCFLSLCLCAHGFKFDCDTVVNCHCEKDGYNKGEWEIQCPRGRHEIFITLKIKTLLSGNGFLTVTCNDQEPKMPSAQLLEGIHFNSNSAGITEIVFQYCPIASQTNPYLFKDFFTQVKIDQEKITSFVIIPPPRYPIQLPSDLFVYMPSLEILDLQKLNLTTIPDLSHLPNLKDLKLRNNLIESIDTKTFQNNGKLKYIDLSVNDITEIPDLLFPTSLESLNLAKNRINRTSPQTFSRLTSLQHLVLTRNPLVFFHVDTFNDTPSLAHLQMDSAKFLQFPKLENLLNLVEVSISDRAFDSNEIFLKKFDINISNKPYLRKIVLSSDGIETFPTLHNLPDLVELQLNGNRITNIPAEKLNLPKLELLNLNSNRIVKISTIQTPHLISLDLGGNYLEQLTSTMFSELTNLISLRLTSNKLQIIDSKAFKSVSELRSLDLSKNMLSFEKQNPNQDQLGNGSYEDVWKIVFDHSPLHWLKKLETLDLSSNRIQYIFLDWRHLLGKLRHLNLSHNSIYDLQPSDLDFDSRELNLDVAYNQISTIDVQFAAFIVNTTGRILRVFVDGNPLNCNCGLVAFKRFQLDGIYFKFTNLTCNEPNWLQGIPFREITSTDLMCPISAIQGCPSPCDCWKIPGNQTIAIDCSYRAIGNSITPNLHNFMTEKATERYNFTLNLAGNNMSTLGFNRTQIITSRILKVDLSENQLTSLGFFNHLVNNNISSFYLSGNRFSCDDCDFYRTLRSHFRRVTDYKNMSCLFLTDSSYGDDSTLLRYYVDDFPEVEVCLHSALPPEVQAILVLSSIFLILTLIFIVIYFRYGWAIRALLYSKGLGCCFGFDDPEDDQEKIYDAFVSYSHKDEDWVLTQLVTRLEGQEGFKLCLHFRDWTPGDWIPDQIVRSVDKSRRTVVILSKHFVDSIWSRLEFKAAHSQALSDKTNRLILVMMDDDLKDQDIKDDDLRVYMKMNTYLKYGDPWFWHKLKYALPHKKATVEMRYLKQQQRERAIRLDKLRSKMESTIT